MLHAYRLVYPFSKHAPAQLWEYEQPYIADLILNARTFDRGVVQWYFEDWHALGSGSIVPDVPLVPERCSRVRLAIMEYSTRFA